MWQLTNGKSAFFLQNIRKTRITNLAHRCQILTLNQRIEKKGTTTLGGNAICELWNIVPSFSLLSNYACESR